MKGSFYKKIKYSKFTHATILLILKILLLNKKMKDNKYIHATILLILMVIAYYSGNPLGPIIVFAAMIFGIIAGPIGQIISAVITLIFLYI